jgi:hypothetical protein
MGSESASFEGFEAFHYLARAIVESSGAPPKEERRVLLSAARSWGVRPAAAVAILTSVADPDAEELPPPQDSERRGEILYQAATVAMADGHLAQDERRYLSRLARGLGFGVEEVREALARAERERSYQRPQETQGRPGLELQPLAGDLVEGELELSDEAPKPVMRFACRSPGGTKTEVRLFHPDHGFEVVTPAGARQFAYADVTGVSLGLNADETCVCGIHLRRGAALRVTNASATHGNDDYEYLAFVRKFHALLKRAKVRPEFHVTRSSGGRRDLWLRAALVTIPTVVILFGLVRWTMGFEEVFLPGCVTFLIGVVGVVASGHLVIQALRSDGEEYSPPDFPTSVLPGAEDLSVGEALGKGGVAALWVIATVMSSDD